jgi:hypothetical protein
MEKKIQDIIIGAQLGGYTSGEAAKKVFDMIHEMKDSSIKNEYIENFNRATCMCGRRGISPITGLCNLCDF